MICLSFFCNISVPFSFLLFFFNSVECYSQGYFVRGYFNSLQYSTITILLIAHLFICVSIVLREYYITSFLVFHYILCWAKEMTFLFKKHIGIILNVRAMSILLFYAISTVRCTMILCCVCVPTRSVLLCCCKSLANLSKKIIVIFFLPFCDNPYPKFVLLIPFWCLWSHTLDIMQCPLRFLSMPCFFSLCICMLLYFHWIPSKTLMNPLFLPSVLYYTCSIEIYFFAIVGMFVSYSTSVLSFSELKCSTS